MNVAKVYCLGTDLQDTWTHFTKVLHIVAGADRINVFVFNLLLLFSDLIGIVLITYVKFFQKLLIGNTPKNTSYMNHKSPYNI